MRSRLILSSVMLLVAIAAVIMIAHAQVGPIGQTGGPITVSTPASAVSANGTIPPGVCISWGDTSISRTSPGGISFGNGTCGDPTANLLANNYTTQNGGGAFTVTGRSAFLSTADKLVQLENNANTTGVEFNVGTPTLGTCVGGSVTSGSHNTMGEVTGNTSGSCIINFGIPNFTNTPFCTINDESALIAVQISARSASSMTVTGAASGNNFQWICLGRIGT